MLIIREYREENPNRICHVYEAREPKTTTQADTLTPLVGAEPAADNLIAIDEDFLAWLYIAPGYEESDRSRKLLALARQLIGSDAWAVVQVGSGHDQEVLERMQLEVIESYENTAPTPRGVSIHLTRTV